MRWKAPGVISVFAAIAWCLAASVLFVLLDGIRVSAMGEFLGDRVHLACRNVMANYQKELYEEYGILGIDEVFSRTDEACSQSGEGYGNVVEMMLMQELEYEKELEQKNLAANSVYSARIDLLRYPSMEISNGGYQLLSDGGGEAFLRQAASYMTALLPEQAAENILNEYKEQNVFQQKNDVGKIYAGACRALKTASRLLEQSQENGGDDSDSELEDNILTAVEKRRSDPVLDLVLPAREISSGYMNIECSPSERTLLKGTMPTNSITALEKVLGISYCSRMFTDFLSQEASADKTQMETGLCYQVEYVIAGNDTDRENLSAVCSRLLVIREAVQFARYCADPQKTARAYTEATALVGFTGNPVLIEAVQLGFLAAWSFEDAIKDVRTLLAGEKVSLSGTAASTMYGYRDYLKLLLFVEPAGEMAMRSLDIIENQINAKLEEGDFYVDRTITAMEGLAEAEIPWIFVNLVMVPVDSLGNCRKSVSWSEDYR